MIQEFTNACGVDGTEDVSSPLRPLVEYACRFEAQVSLVWAECDAWDGCDAARAVRGESSTER